MAQGPTNDPRNSRSLDVSAVISGARTLAPDPTVAELAGSLMTGRDEGEIVALSTGRSSRLSLTEGPHIGHDRSYILTEVGADEKRSQILIAGNGGSIVMEGAPSVTALEALLEDEQINHELLEKNGFSNLFNDVMERLKMPHAEELSLTESLGDEFVEALEHVFADIDIRSGLLNFSPEMRRDLIEGLYVIGSDMQLLPVYTLEAMILDAQYQKTENLEALSLSRELIQKVAIEGLEFLSDQDLIELMINPRNLSALADRVSELWGIDDCESPWLPHFYRAVEGNIELQLRRETSNNKKMLEQKPEEDTEN